MVRLAGSIRNRKSVPPSHFSLESFSKAHPSLIPGLLLLLMALCYAPSSAFASSTPYIYTVAGNGTNGYSGDGGPATFADLNYPGNTVMDGSGNLYIADSNNNAVRKVAAGTGIISTIAGTGISGYSGDGGPATSARLKFPSALALDSAGNLYIADTYNNVIRRVDAASGVITTYAGVGIAGFGGDNGPATSAKFYYPEGLDLDASGNLYIADLDNNRVRMVNASTGVITTVAGSASGGYSGDGGPATSAGLAQPYALALDTAGNLYICDSRHSVIRKVAAGTQIISTVAGNGFGSTQGTGGYTGDGGPATSAELYYPQGIAVDGSGDLFIADTYNQAIREVSAATGIITTIVGGVTKGGCFPAGGDGGLAASASLCYPGSIFLGANGNAYISEFGDSRIREVAMSQAPPAAAAAPPTFSVSPGTYANSQTVTVSDATPGAAVYLLLEGASPSTRSPQYNGPINVSGDVTINAVAVAPGYLVSAPVTASYKITSPPVSVITTFAGNGDTGSTTAGVTATSASLPSLGGLAFNSAGDLYFTEPQFNTVWEVSAKTGLVEAVAGTGVQGFSGDGGPANSAEFKAPTGLAIDGAGNLYIADAGNNRIREVSAATGIISTIAGDGVPAVFTWNGGFDTSSLGDGGPATAAELNNPQRIAFDSAGNLYIADTYDNLVRKVSASTGIITTVAGDGSGIVNGDGGSATSAGVGTPYSIALDGAGNLYIADSSSIRKVTASTGVIITIAGNNSAIGGYSGDGGPATSAEIQSQWMALDRNSNVYFSNFPNGVREVFAATGIITTVAGNGYSFYGGDGGSATIAGLNGPAGIAFDPSGNLYIADAGDNRIRMVSSTPTSTPVFNPPSGTYTGPQSVIVTDATQGAVIYYTTDGSTPTTSSSVYSGPVSVSQSETLNAFAVAPGYAQSSIATAAYTINLAIGTAAPSISVSPTTQTITDKQSATLTVTVSGAAGQPTPTGSVTVTSGSYSAAQPLSSGAASISVPGASLAAGVNAVSVSYSGDATYSAASGSTQITVSPLALSVASLATVAPGASATATVPLHAGSSYSGTVKLSCALISSPSGAQSLPSCSLTPNSVTLASGGSATSTLTVQTTAAGNVALLKQPGQRFRWLGGGGAAFALVFLFGIPGKRRRWTQSLMLLLLVASVTMIGCGGSGSQGSTSNSPPTTPATTAGNYTFSVTGTDSANASVTASANVTITVQ